MHTACIPQGQHFKWFFFSLLRSDLLNDLIAQWNDEASESQTHPAVRSPAPNQSLKWLSHLLSHQPASGARRALPSLAWARPTEAPQTESRKPRARRHAHFGTRGHHYPHHAQLMRVGCVLGTCQVQNLSHRLYQLIGQSGREDSSPINPKSPHSYGWLRCRLWTPTASLSIYHLFISKCVTGSCCIRVDVVHLFIWWHLYSSEMTVVHPLFVLIDGFEIENHVKDCDGLAHLWNPPMSRHPENFSRTFKFC